MNSKSITTILMATLAVACSTTQQAPAASPPSEPAVPAAKPTVKFDNQDYQLAFVKKGGDGTINEYLRPGESVESWKQMLTVSESRGTFDLTAYVKLYVSTIKDRLAMEPEVFAKGDKEVLIVSILVAPDKSHSEFTIFRATVVPNVGVKSYGFSKWMPLKEKVDFTDVMTHKDQWLSQISALDISTVADSTH